VQDVDDVLSALQQNEAELRDARDALPPMGQAGEPKDPKYRKAYQDLKQSLDKAIADLNIINNGLAHVERALERFSPPTEPE